MTVAQFARQHRITADVAWADSNPNAPEWVDARHFLVTLRRGRRRMAVPFSQGLGIERGPTVADVLGCLASDASCEDKSYEEWASDFGYDPDTRTAERHYRIIVRYIARLRRFLGDDLMAALRDCES